MGYQWLFVSSFLFCFSAELAALCVSKWTPHEKQIQKMLGYGLQWEWFPGHPFWKREVLYIPNFLSRNAANLLSLEGMCSQASGLKGKVQWPLCYRTIRSCLLERLKIALCWALWILWWQQTRPLSVLLVCACVHVRERDRHSSLCCSTTPELSCYFSAFSCNSNICNNDLKECTVAIAKMHLK